MSLQRAIGEVRAYLPQECIVGRILRGNSCPARAKMQHYCMDSMPECIERDIPQALAKWPLVAVVTCPCLFEPITLRPGSRRLAPTRDSNGLTRQRLRTTAIRRLKPVRGDSIFAAEFFDCFEQSLEGT